MVSKEYYVGNYLRLSIDSDYTGSDSLENQRKLAKEYISNHKDLITIKEYVDDGKTGTNFERPAFNRMIADLKQGIINCVMVKDLSRFGREYIEAGNYIEKVFPFLGVRFISIVDRYDSEELGCDRELLLISLKNLMHEMYAKDISKKIGSVFQIKQEKKIFYRSATIPYGYKMNEENTNYIVCRETAEVVKEIYMQYEKGVSKYSICKFLYEKNIMTPRQYNQTGRVHREADDEVKVWMLSTIDRMLRNPVYTGMVLRHRSEQSLFEEKALRAVPENEQVLLENNHEPIISKELFIEVQKRRKRIKDIYVNYRSNTSYIKHPIIFEKNVFQGKIFCGNCKANMVKVGAYRSVDGKEEKYKVFKCSTHRNMSVLCDTRFIEEKVLCEILYDMICKQLCIIKELKKVIDKDVRYSFENKLQCIKHEEQRIGNDKVLLEQEYMQMYSDYTTKNITVDVFQKFRKMYLQKVKFYKNQIEELKRKKKEVNKCKFALKKLVKDWIEFGNEEQVTECMIETCVDRIEIFTGKRIEVKLRYQDCFYLLEKWIKEGV